MCCFSGYVGKVECTRIYARPLDDGRQVLAYSMNLAHEGELAMILPLPTPPGAPEDAVEFVDLSEVPDFFERLNAVFSEARSMAFGGALAPAPLKVVEVGAFDASFVPRLADFERLDPRFRLPPQVWDQLPQYADHGFVVFALRAAAQQLVPVHPMAFRFPRRDRGEVFFPTVHVHDGEVHPTADFDHHLYLQVDGAVDGDWERSARGMTESRDVVGRLVAAGRPVYRQILMGDLPNRDQIVAAPRA